MALNFKVYERQDRKSLGTIESLIGAGGSIRLASAANFLSDKRVVIVLERADGTSGTVVCSPAVSEGLRDRSIALSQVLDFEVCEYLSASGEITNTVVKPSAAVGDMPSVKAGAARKAYQPVSKFKPEELVEL